MRTSPFYNGGIKCTIWSCSPARNEEDFTLNKLFLLALVGFVLATGLALPFNEDGDQTSDALKSEDAERDLHWNPEDDLGEDENNVDENDIGENEGGEEDCEDDVDHDDEDQDDEDDDNPLSNSLKKS
ncbi:hypothetical protein ACROYT_G024849 [Oculina patagonica]